MTPLVWGERWRVRTWASSGPLAMKRAKLADQVWTLWVACGRWEGRTLSRQGVPEAMGQPVKALVRTTAAPVAVEDLKALGIDVVEGDLRDPASLTRACQGVATVISTATAISGRQPGDSISEIDLRGQRNLVDVAGASGVRHLIYTSFSGNLRTPEPLGDSNGLWSAP